MNIVNLIGNLGKDIELKKTESGKSVVRLSLAVRRTKEITDWLPCVVWDNAADYLDRYAKKGDKIAVTGQLRTRKYEDRWFYEVHSSNVEILSSRPKQDEIAQQAQELEPEPTVEISPDDLPF